MELIFDLIIDIWHIIIYGTSDNKVNEKKPLYFRVILGFILGLVFIGELALLFFGFIWSNAIMLLAGVILISIYIISIVEALLLKPKL